MSRKDAHFLRSRDRIPSMVRKLSSTTDRRSSKLEVTASQCPGFPDREEDDRPISRLRRGFISTIGDDTTCLPRSFTLLGFSKLSQAQSFFLESDSHLWSSDGTAELGIIFTPSTAEQFCQNYAART